MLVVTWAAAGQPADIPTSTTRIHVEPVAVESPPVRVSTSWSADVVVGVESEVCFSVENRGPLVQEVAVAVTDSASFVFAGDRSTSVLVMPHSTTELRHTFVAHSPGWQPLPEVALTLRRYSARLVPTAAARLVCVRPAGLGASF